MKGSRKSVCLITSGLVEANARLQPWRYLSEVACQLAVQGHDVTVISDGPTASGDTWLEGVNILHLPKVSNPWSRPNKALQRIVQQLAPDVILWHVGLTSLLHQKLSLGNAPVIGIFTSPIYTLSELYSIGWMKLARGYQLSAVHLAGSLMPKRLVRLMVRQNRQMQHVVVQTETTCRQLINSGVWPQPATVIRPGVDHCWRQHDQNEVQILRQQLGYGLSDTVVLYFGSPVPLRGLHTLIKAVDLARTVDPSLRLLILSRRREDELRREDTALERMVRRSRTQPFVNVISGYLDQESLVNHVALADIVALPFELVTSDAPISLLEAQAMGKTIVTTKVACLPELVSSGDDYLALSANRESLAHTLQQAAKELRNPNNGWPELTRSEVAKRSWWQMGEEWSSFILSLEY